MAALAGSGAGARLEFILVSLSYGIGGPAGILIGTNIGAGLGRCALRTAWITLLLSALATEAIGLAGATWPAAWIGSFSGDPAVLAIGTTYLRTVGPFFGFFGIGYGLYCAGQRRWRCRDHLGANLDHIFMDVSIGMMSFGLFSLPGLFLRSGYGTRQRSSAARGPTAVCTR